MRVSHVYSDLWEWARFPEHPQEGTPSQCRLSATSISSVRAEEPRSPAHTEPTRTTGLHRWREELRPDVRQRAGGEGGLARAGPSRGFSSRDRNPSAPAHPTQLLMRPPQPTPAVPSDQRADSLVRFTWTLGRCDHFIFSILSFPFIFSLAERCNRNRYKPLHLMGRLFLNASLGEGVIAMKKNDRPACGKSP